MVYILDALLCGIDFYAYRFLLETRGYLRKGQHNQLC